MKNKFFLILFFVVFSFAKANNLENFIDDLQEKENIINNKNNENKENEIFEENFIKNQDEKRFVNNVKIRILDKITGKSNIITEKIGNTYKIKDFEFVFLKCWKSYPEELPENKLLLKIIKTEESATKKTIFFGWIFSSRTSLNTFNNELYDVNLINCD